MLHEKVYSESCYLFLKVNQVFAKIDLLFLIIIFLELLNKEFLKLLFVAQFHLIMLCDDIIKSVQFNLLYFDFCYNLYFF